MTTTVYYATNRVVNNPLDGAPGSYTANMIAPADEMTYGTAFVDSANFPADNVGVIRSLQPLQKSDFFQTVMGDIGSGGRNILVFIHGFANTFSDAITRAGFNREWLAQSGVPGADTTVIAFCWPSFGRVIVPPTLTHAYHTDQQTAGRSGLHLVQFLTTLSPMLQFARSEKGLRAFLLAHSMGNWALQAAMEAWFANGGAGPIELFDEAVLAAADEEFTSFDHGPTGRLSALNQLARRISIYHSTGDKVLDDLSETINFIQRLGQQGPAGFPNEGRFPSSTYRVVDCSGFTDYDRSFQGTHQYYRRSEGVRADIASVMA